jgi:predicted esterase
MDRSGQPADAAPSPRRGRAHVMARGFALALVVANLASLAIGGYNRFPSSDEARALAGGLSLWGTGDPGFADVTPPLSRLAATLPLLPSRPPHPDAPGREGCHDLEGWSRFEDRLGGELAGSMLPESYLEMVRLSRLVGYAWWMLGAWLVVSWSRELYGAVAGWLALALWASGPNVVGAEVEIGSALPAAVAAAAATFAFRRHLRQPSWDTALAAGLLWGISLLADYLALALIAAWTAAWIASRGQGTSRPGGVKNAIAGAGRAVLLLLASLWVVNLGCGFFRQNWRPLGNYDFDSRVLAGAALSEDSLPGPQTHGNRFRGTIIGGLVIPLPPDYLRGLDRWLWEAEADDQTSTGRTTAKRSRAALMTIAASAPLANWAMLAWAATLTLRRRGVSLADELCLWGPAVAVAVAATFGTRLVPPGRALVLASPFVMIAVARLARTFGRACGRGRAAWPTLLFTAWSVVGGLAGSWGGRPYLNEAAGGPGNFRSQAACGRDDGGPDLLALRAWLERNPEARPLGTAVRHVINLRPFGLETVPPPIDPGAAIANRPGHEQKVGPYPGTYALDARGLREDGYDYFRHFRPAARVGTGILIYRIARDEADRVRRARGLPALDAPRLPPPEGRGFLRRVYRDGSGDDSQYTVFVPYGYTGENPCPLILFLHGAGDAGTEGDNYLKVGLPVAVEAHKDAFDFVAVFPQGRKGYWTPGSWDGRRALAILERVEREYNVDRRRVYLTGLSSGGAGVWALAAGDPGRWAAIAPVSSGGSDAATALRIARIPCWCFQNSNDEMTPPAGARAMIAALRRAGGMLKYTESFYPGTTPAEKHNAWGRAYEGPALYDWLLRHRLGDGGQ